MSLYSHPTGDLGPFNTIVSRERQLEHIQAEKMAEETAKREDAEKADSSISKSERIRRYLRDNPEARNVDIADALGKYGVTAADVASTKTQMRKREEKAANKHGGSAGGYSSVAAPSKNGNGHTDPLSLDKNFPDVQIGLDAIEEGMDFIRKAGGMNEAQHILNLIRRIKQI